jgi:hypothetical protein
MHPPKPNLPPPSSPPPPPRQAWLEKQSTPGSSASLDKASYAQAVATFNALQAAAAKGPDYLDQVGGLSGGGWG